MLQGARNDITRNDTKRICTTLNVLLHSITTIDSHRPSNFVFARLVYIYAPCKPASNVQSWHVMRSKKEAPEPIGEDGLANCPSYQFQRIGLGRFRFVHHIRTSTNLGVRLATCYHDSSNLVRKAPENGSTKLDAKLADPPPLRCLLALRLGLHLHPGPENQLQKGEYNSDQGIPSLVVDNAPTPLNHLYASRIVLASGQL